ncbi:hypothetical protein TNCT_34401 [Trichonephila clavata]|uniref:Uncharacterized protein n=1 Tax=Trichonephila clavata TaxID=2740835 RepID=A0A8X6HM62_TRICU|nr:hypothetical protein TNCT_34401 [Trichonephila clavata]
MQNREKGTGCPRFGTAGDAFSIACLKKGPSHTGQREVGVVRVIGSVSWGCSLIVSCPRYPVKDLIWERVPAVPSGFRVSIISCSEHPPPRRD